MTANCRSKSIASLIAIALAVPAFAQPQKPAAQPMPAAAAAASAPRPTDPVVPPGYVIGTDDVLSIVYWKDKDMSADAQVRPDGRIALPLINEVVAAGLTTAGTVYGIGSIGDQTGDFATTYLGTGIGFVMAWGLQRSLLGPHERPRSGMSTAMRWTVANVLASLPAAGATIGFNSTRRTK